jgi:hypothetical protein
MPAKTAKQKRLMDAAAHNPAFAKKVGIPQSVAMDFSKASKGKKFQKGGETMKKSAKAMPFKGMETMMEEKAEKKAKGMKKSGMHKMPDGKMMKDSAMAKGGAAMRGQGIAERGYSEGGRVQVRGVGAARARTAKIC